MPTLTPQEFASGCWMSEYQYEGPGSTQNGHDSMIHATLKPEAEKYSSGFQVLIGCKNAMTQEVIALVRCFGTCETIGVRNAHAITKEFLP